jgi:hypothetical protein
MRKQINWLIPVCCWLSFLSSGQQINTLTVSAAADVEDAYIDASAPSATNNGVLLAVKVNSSVNYLRTYIRFNLSAIPSTAKIISAQLMLTNTSATDDAGTTGLTVMRNTGTWTETTLTFNNKPTNSTTDAIMTSSLSGLVRTIDVKNHVQLMIRQYTPNYGWQISRRNESIATTGCLFHSKTSSTTTAVPKLVVRWYIPMNVTNAVVTHAASTTVSNGAIVPAVANGLGTKAYQWTRGNAGTTVGTASSISNIQSDWYGLRVIDSIADTLYMAFLVGAECSPFQVNFNPGKNYISDAYLSGQVEPAVSFTETNYGGSTSFQAARWNSGTSNWYDLKSPMQFLLWADPAITFSRADLNVYGINHQNSGTGFRENAVQMHRITGLWREYEVNMQNMPATTSAQSATKASTTSATQNDVYSLLSFWNLWKTNNLTNYGLLLQLTDRTTDTKSIRQYASSDHATESMRPNLDFTYTVTGSCEYFHLKVSQDQSVAYVPGSKLRVKFEEDYFDASGTLTYTLTSLTTDVAPAVVNIPKGNQTNWIEILFGSNYVPVVSGDIYMLEVKDVKGRAMYLKFKKV